MEHAINVIGGINNGKSHLDKGAIKLIPAASETGRSGAEHD